MKNVKLTAEQNPNQAMPACRQTADFKRQRHGELILDLFIDQVGLTNKTVEIVYCTPWKLTKLYYVLVGYN